MKFIISLFFFFFLLYCALMVVYGFWLLFIWLGWLDDPQPPDKPPDKPLNDPINIALPQKVNMMEWEVSGNNTSIRSIQDVNSQPINFKI